MKKFIKLLSLFILLLFCYSCGSAKDALVGKKRSEQGDEFLIDKKNPLIMQPDFDKLPHPGDTKKNTTKNEDDNEIKDLLILDQEEVNNEINNQSTDIESSIIKKIQ